MKLYYAPGACSLAVRIIMHEIGIDCEYESVNLRTKVTQSNQDFLTINSKGSVPTIVTDNNEILTENAVILQYLADTHKAYNLLPALGDFNRYRVLEWVNYITTELHKTAGVFFNPTISQEIKNENFKPLLKTKLHYVNQKIKGNTLMGNAFTLPDAYLFVILTWLPGIGIDIAEFNNLNRYFSELKNRPSVQQSLKEENLK